MRTSMSVLLSALATFPVAASAQGNAAEPAITKLPVLQHFEEAIYPAAAAKEGINAVVLLEIDIDEEGLVERAAVIEAAAPSGYGFDEAALHAVLRFRFEPAEAAGSPIAVTMSYRYHFTMLAPRPSIPPPEPPAPVLSLRGRLIERGTRTPVIGATVTVFRGEGGEAVGFDAISDAEGYFDVYDLEPGEWKVLCGPVGYYPVRTAEQVESGDILEVSYLLEKRSYNPFDVMVEARRAKKEVVRRTVNMKEVERVPGTFGDPLGVVTNLPSVARMPMGSGALIVRGSSPEDTRVNIDGINVPYLYHFGGIRTAIPAGMLESIDFYPGNYAVDHGRAIGGLLDVRPKRLKPERFGGHIDTSFLDTGLYVETPIGEQSAIAVGGRRSYVDVLIKQFMPDDGPVSMTVAPRYYDYQLLARTRFAGSHELRALVFGSDDRWEMVFANPADMDIELKATRFTAASSFYRGIIEHTWTLSPDTNNEIVIAIGRDMTRQSLGEQLHLDFDVLQGQLRETLTHKAAPSLTLRAGIDTISSLADYDVHINRPAKEGEARNQDLNADEIRTTKIENLMTHSPAIFAEAQWQATDTLLLVPGIRVDYMGDVGAVTADPRLTARLTQSDALAFKAGVGLFHQAPTVDELDPSFGNPALGVERAIHVSAGAELQLLERLSLDTTLFFKDMRNVIGASDALVERNGQLVAEVYSNAGRGRVYGVDIMLRHELAHGFFGWVAYTVSRSERRDPGARTYRLFDFDQTHILTVVGSYQLPRNWEVSTRWRLVSGNPYTPIQGAAYSVDDDQYKAAFGRLNSARLPPFHQLDLRVDKRWVYDGWMLSAYFDIQNTYDQPNAEGYSYNYDYSQKEQATGLTFLTIAGLKAEF